MFDFLSGMLMMTWFVNAILFTRHWRRSGDRLFLIFACSFALLSFEQVAVLIANANTEALPYIYFFRFIAFLSILSGIFDKNISSQTFKY